MELEEMNSRCGNGKFRVNGKGIFQCKVYSRWVMECGDCSWCDGQDYVEIEEW